MIADLWTWACELAAEHPLWVMMSALGLVCGCLLLVGRACDPGRHTR